jgi:hypothetical protein
MAEPYDSIFDQFIAEFGDNEAEMNTVSGVIILNRNVDPDSSTVLCTRVEELLQPSKVIKQENFEWVTCGGESKELSLCEEFLNAGVGNFALCHLSARLIDVLASAKRVRVIWQSIGPLFTTWIA